MGRPDSVDSRTQRENEIERCRYPNPIFRSGAAAWDRRQNPSREPDERGVHKVNLEVIQRARDVLMHVFSLRGCGCSCRSAPRFEEPLTPSA